MQPSVSQFAIPVISMLTKKLAVLYSAFVAGFFATPIFAFEVTESAGAAHGYPGLCDINGKKLANGEFRQWVASLDTGEGTILRTTDSGSSFEVCGCQ